MNKPLPFPSASPTSRHSSANGRAPASRPPEVGAPSSVEPIAPFKPIGSFADALLKKVKPA